MKPGATAVTIVSALGVIGCQTVELDHDQPARLVSGDTDSQATLQATVDAALGTHVTLSATALTDSSLLTIENRPPPTMDNPVPQGREMSLPIQFRLVRNGSDCILVRQSDRTRHLLDNTDCTPE